MRETKMVSVADGFPFKNTPEVEGGWGWGGKITTAVPFENLLEPKPLAVI